MLLSYCEESSKQNRQKSLQLWKEMKMNIQELNELSILVIDKHEGKK